MKSIKRKRNALVGAVALAVTSLFVTASPASALKIGGVVVDPAPAYEDPFAQYCWVNGVIFHPWWEGAPNGFGWYEWYYRCIWD